MMDLQKILVPETASLLEALQVINDGAIQVAFVVDEGNCLVGSVTDGDVRRALLGGHDLSVSVQKALNNNPYTVQADRSREEILALMRQYGVHHLPVVDAHNRILRIEWLDDLLQQDIRQDVWVVIMAGGLGTRLGELTRDVPKPMLPVGGKPLLESTIRNLAAQGFVNFYLSVNYKAEVIEDYFGDGSRHGVNIRYLHETKRLGTAGSLSLLPEKPDGTFIVMNGDVLTNVSLRHLIRFHEEYKGMATLCGREYVYEVPFGVMETDGVYLQTIREKPRQQFMVNSGIYALSPACLDHVPGDTFFDMPALFDAILATGDKVSVFPIHEYWMDIGKHEDLHQARGDIDRVFDQ